MSLFNRLAASFKIGGWLGASRCLVLGAAGLVPALVQAQSITYSAPITITKGGTYTGNYQSLDSNVPCVLVNTNEPVVLEGCRFSGAGNLVQSGSGANLTVRNCTGVGLTPSVDGQAPGRFLDTYQSQNLVVEHNLFTQTSGIVVNRWSGNSGTLAVRYNQARNIDGRWRNNAGSSRSSFVILNTVQRLSGVEIAYNEVINTPNQSLVEDNINFYNSSGTAASPIRVHDNFVRGAYPYPATSSSFTGTGLTTDGDANTFDNATGYIEASYNQFVGTCNAAMNIAAGHDVYYHDNRMVTSALLADGTPLNATYAATAVFNYYNQLLSIFFNNRIANNTIGYVKWGASNPFSNRQDLSPGSCATCTGTTSLPNPITYATEDNEYSLWQQKVQQAGVTLGPLGNTAPAPAPAPTPAPSTAGITNPGFEADNAAVGSPTGWSTATGTGTSDNADYTETYPGAHSGTYHGTHYRPLPYEVYTYQTVTGLANGTYSLSAWVKTGGGQYTAQLVAKNFGSGATLTADISDTNGSWVQVTVPNVVVTNGQCELGVYSKARLGNWLYFDDFTLTKAQANVAPTVSLTASATTLTQGAALTLSATAADSDGLIAKVEFYDGTTKLGEATSSPYQLNWTPGATGSYSLTAVATDNAGASTTSSAVAVTVNAAPAAPAPTTPTTNPGTNLAANPGFEADNAAVGSPTGWSTITGTNTNDNADYTETYPGAHSGSYHGTHYRPVGYEVYSYQTIKNLPNGTYSLTAWVKSSGLQPVAQLQAKNFGSSTALTTDITMSIINWTQVTIDNITVTNGQCEIGFYSKAYGGQWLYFDDISFTAKPTSVTATNTVLNASFDDDNTGTVSPKRWSVWTGGFTPSYASYTEAYGGAHSGTYHGTHYRTLPYEVYTYQIVTGLTNGTYSLSAWVKTDGGQNTLQLIAKNFGNSNLATNITATNGDWVQVRVNNIAVTNGQCEIGFYSKASAGQWLYFDDVALVSQQTTTAAASTPVSTGTATSITSSDDGFKLYPNPADSQVTIDATYAQYDNVLIMILDLQGNLVVQHWRTAFAGSNSFTIPTNYVPTGTYTVRISSSSQATQVLHLEVRH